MKLQNLINRIEKATSQKVELNGNMYWLRNGNNSVSFFENGEGSGSVVSVCCTMRAEQERDGNPMNQNCYDSYERKLKGVISFIA